MSKKPTIHLKHLEENIETTNALLAIHEMVTGTNAGRRQEAITVLNKSAIILLVACWEVFVEELADKAVTSLSNKMRSHTNLPKNLKKQIAESLKGDKNELSIWDLAGDGWKAVLKNLARRSIKNLNTPSATNIDELFLNTIGLPILSKSWSWKRVIPAKARKKLDSMIKLRGDITHKMKSAKSVQKGIVESYIKFVNQLARCSHRRIEQYMERLQ